MSIFSDADASSAQRALARLLVTAFGERGRAEAAVVAALREARLSAAPQSADDVLSFARTFLAPILATQIPSALIAALMDDLDAEAEHARTSHDPNSSSRIALATRVPRQSNEVAALMEASVAIPAYRAPRIDGFPSSAAFRVSEPAPSDGHVTRPADTGEQQQLRGATRSRHYSGRPSVLLVDSDRLGRASLARGLVSGGCDVVVLDDPKEVVRLVHDGARIDVVVTEINGLDAPPMLRALATHRPDVAIVVWTKTARAVAEHVLQQADVAQSEIASKNARIAEVVEQVRRLGEL